MKQEFVTLYGKAMIEKEVLHFRSPYLPFSKTAFAQISYDLLIVAIFISSFFFDDEGPKKYVRILVFGFLVLGRLPSIYDKVFKRSYAGRIPLEKIKSFKIEDDHHGIQTEITLYLTNGRYKKILFRKLENQYEAFLQAISLHSFQAQPA